jgi:serine/threonine protein kinase
MTNGLIPAAPDFETIQNRIQLVHNSIADSRSEWEKKVKIAGENEARKLRTFESVSSYPNGLHGERLPSYTTKADFKFRRSLGSGAFGQVAEVVEATTGQVYARKIIAFREDSKSKGSIEKEVLNEVSIMQRLRHQHIASVLFFVRQLDTFSIFMLPVAECDLLFVLENSLAVEESSDLTRGPSLLDTWFGCLISALAYAHNLKIKHEDIKPSNILIKEKQPYLADFGSAKDFAKLDMSISRDEIIKGTPIYLAPEPATERGRAADIFALGCVFSEMLTVRQGKTVDEYRDYRRVPNDENGLAFRLNLESVEMWLKGLERLGAMGRVVREQTLAMLQSDPEMRPSATDVKKFFRREEALFCESC